jgi:hypothetical protein
LLLQNDQPDEVPGSGNFLKPRVGQRLRFEPVAALVPVFVFDLEEASKCVPMILYHGRTTCGALAPAAKC